MKTTATRGKWDEIAAITYINIIKDTLELSGLVEAQKYVKD